MSRKNVHQKKSTKKQQAPRGASGIISITRKGRGFVTIPGFDEDVEIGRDDLTTALHGDTVEISLFPKEINKRQAGKVTKVVKRTTTRFVGTAKKEGGNTILKPDDPRFYKEILLENPPANLAANTKVLVQLLPWSDPSKAPRGKLQEIIGRAGEHETEMRAIVLSHGFDHDFEKEIEEEAKEIEKNKKITAEEIAKRRDLRNAITFTIDPDDAKDFDDALSIAPAGEGLWEVGIHIADVSHYVRPGSAIDREARDRGTSIYLVDRTIPMLPEVLSNDVCSLNPNEDKLTYSAIFVLDSEARVQRRWFGKTIIHSDKRFTYEGAQNVLKSGKGPFASELKTLDVLAKKLQERRFKKGAIDFDQEEIKFELDAKGKPIRVVKKERMETNKLIEDFMLLANREVATHFQKLCKKFPEARRTFVYRIHDMPDPEKIEELGIFVRAIGYEFATGGGEIDAGAINRLFKQIEGKPEETLIKTATIRSMAKAVYSTKNIGHFGLSFEYYTHFTSPIRRYPDVMVHRILKQHLDNEPLSHKELMRYEQLAIQSSQKEVEAVEAERDSVKLKQVEYMQDKVGQTFEGLITGVTDWGVYVEEKESKAEGLLRVSNLAGDYFELDRKHFALVGTRTKRKYALGDTLPIKLIAANPLERTLEWELAK